MYVCMYVCMFVFDPELIVFDPELMFLIQSLSLETSQYHSLVPPYSNS